MIRFALIAASTLGFFLTAALGNLMTPARILFSFITLCYHKK